MTVTRLTRRREYMCPPSTDSPDQCSHVAIPRKVLTDHVGVDIVVLGEF